MSGTPVDLHARVARPTTLLICQVMTSESMVPDGRLDRPPGGLSDVGAKRRTSVRVVAWPPHASIHPRAPNAMQRHPRVIPPVAFLFAALVTPGRDGRDGLADAARTRISARTGPRRGKVHANDPATLKELLVAAARLRASWNGRGGCPLLSCPFCPACLDRIVSNFLAPVAGRTRRRRNSSVELRARPRRPAHRGSGQVPALPVCPSGAPYQVADR